MNHKLGIIVPYRNRPEQLEVFKNSIQDYIKDIEYELIVVDQQDENDFNRGKLLNIGFLHAKQKNCDYVVFHDIDMLPDEVDYSFCGEVTHLIGSLDLPEGYSRDLFDTYFGGVTLFPSKLFEAINGYTNRYYGWGFEDDNLLLRCKELGLKLDHKKIPQTARNGIGLKFNGKNSFVAAPNILNTSRDFTFIVNFSIDKINTTSSEITDEHTVFSIPGFDTALTYNSFRNFTFQFWKKDLSSMAITSDHYPEGTYTAIISIENKSNPKVVKFYLNGESVGELTYDKIKNFDAKYIYLGVGDPDRETKRNWLDGKVNTFGLYGCSLNEITIERLSKNINKSLFNFENNDELKIYYDSKFVKNNSIIDLSGNENDGYVFNCDQVLTNFTTEVELPIPNRKKGKFKALPHDENGYKDGYWLNWKSRENQLDYYNSYYGKSTNFNNDGLTTCEYHIESKVEDGNYTHIKVRL